MIPVGLYEKALPAEWSWERRLAATAEAGYDFAEISIDETEERLTRLDWAGGRARRAALRHCYFRRAHPDDVPQRALASIHWAATRRKYAVAGWRSSARRLTSPWISGWGSCRCRGTMSSTSRLTRIPRPTYLDGLHQGTEWASQACLMLGLENVDVSISESITATMRLVTAINSPWFQLYPDMANVAAAGFYPPDELRLAKDHIVAVHVKDGVLKTIRGVPLARASCPSPKHSRRSGSAGFAARWWWKCGATWIAPATRSAQSAPAREFVRPYQEVLDASRRTARDRLEMQPGAA